MNEHELQCPFCYITLSVHVPGGDGDLEWQYDCPSCCNTMTITARRAADGSALEDIRARTA